jgi:hypothetical protein
MLAWLAKVIAHRYGDMHLYRRLPPFFLGLILGDLLQGAFFTVPRCFTEISIYLMNW